MFSDRAPPRKCSQCDLRLNQLNFCVVATSATMSMQNDPPRSWRLGKENPFSPHYEPPISRKKRADGRHFYGIRPIMFVAKYWRRLGPTGHFKVSLGIASVATLWLFSPILIPVGKELINAVRYPEMIGKKVRPPGARTASVFMEIRQKNQDLRRRALASLADKGDISDDDY